MGLVIPLEEIRENQWKAMNSLVHGGIHPLQRMDAFPVELAAQVVRNSNGIAHIACRLLMRLPLAILFSDQSYGWNWPAAPVRGPRRQLTFAGASEGSFLARPRTHSLGHNRPLANRSDFPLLARLG
jgi:hypothetical protein